MNTKSRATINTRPPVLTIALLTSLGLAYEVLLMRLFSITQWHHFAYMIISIALLGYGASGALLTLAQNLANRHFSTLLISNIALFGVSSISCFSIGQSIPFNPLELFWDRAQWGWLFVLYLLLMLPFLCVANSVALVLMCKRQQINVTYAADFMGAGAGALGIVFLLQTLFPEQTLKVIVTLAAVTAFSAMFELKMRKLWLPVIIIVATFPWLLPERWTALTPSAYKPLSQTLNVVGTQLLEQKTSPLGLLSVVASPQVPFRHAPGLSLASVRVPPEQLAVFTDGNGMTVINRFDGQLDAVRYLEETTSALPYQLLPDPRVLILGAGGGTEILQARLHHAQSIDAVELNPQMLELVQHDYAAFAGNIYSAANTTLHVEEARGYVTTTNKTFDLIQISLMDSFSSASAGLTSLNEDYLYTVEALRIYLSRLSADGTLSFTRWLKVPPRDTLKLFATAIVALRQQGVAEPAKHMALIRSWNTTSLLVKKSELTTEDIFRIKQFSTRYSFDLAFYPGITPDDANRYNLLPAPYFYEGAAALLSDSHAAYLEKYKYDLRPSTDNRPYFFHFLKLKTLPEILALPAGQGLPLVEWGTVILYITLLQACLASVFLILLPLWLYQRRQRDSSRLNKRGFVFSYFFAIGLAFLFVEIAFVQKFILFLSHPIYAFAVVISAFLIFAGIGSALSKKREPGKVIRVAITGIVVFALLYLLILPGVFSALIDKAIEMKIIIALLLIAPLAFFMGMPFPVALGYVATVSPQSIPWAWGVNGCASVISAILATILALNFGFSVVIVLALLLYVFAGGLLLQQHRGKRRRAEEEEELVTNNETDSFVG